MSKAHEAFQEQTFQAPALQPPSYEEAMHGAGSFAGASAPFLSSPEHAPVMQPTVMPMPVPMHMPMPSVATDQSGPPGGHMQGMAHVPQMVAPSQPGMAPYPMQAAAPTTVQTTTTVYVSSPPVGPKPCTLTCPMCHQKVRTTTTVTHTGTAHAICILLCIFGCCLCSCLPYCCSGMKITKHECPSCKAYLGSFRP